MKSKIQNKIDSIIEYILDKPNEEITHGDYNILRTELHEIQAREQQENNGKKMADLMSLMYTGFSSNPKMPLTAAPEEKV